MSTASISSNNIDLSSNLDEVVKDRSEFRGINMNHFLSELRSKVPKGATSFPESYSDDWGKLKDTQKRKCKY